MSITVISFGYGHPDGPPTAHVTWDVRDLFRDPHVSRAMRQLTGLDNTVVDSVMAQPGATHYTAVTSAATLSLATMHDLTVAFGCVGGRHRSVVFARALHARVHRLHDVTLIHRDIDKPVLQR